nr:long chain base biosynthesis protein 1-like [Tanacetum cinerariifolium]
MEKEPLELESAAGPHTIIDGKDVGNFALAIYLGLMGHEKLLRLSTLEKVTQDNKRAKKLRRYIVVESVYQNSCQIAPLDEIIRVKEKCRFRVLLDESNSFGVLGASGRGQTEHYKVPIDKVDIITATMGHALASEGGFCTGSNRFIDHQLFYVAVTPQQLRVWADEQHILQKEYETLKIVAASVLTNQN